MNRNTDGAAGTLRISKDVLATIAKASAKEVNGVSCIAENSANIKDMISRGQFAKPVSVVLNDELAEVELHLILQKGCRIPVVSENVQNAVKESIQSMTGIAVSRVNVVIDGITFEADPS